MQALLQSPTRTRPTKPGTATISPKDVTMYSSRGEKDCQERNSVLCLENSVVQPLLTDLYQITMAYAYWKSGKTNDFATFDLFFRRNPFKGEFTIFCGLSDCLALLENFHYSESDITYLRSALPPTVEEEFFVFLKNLNPSEVQVFALPEGSVCFPRIPLMRISGPLITVQLLETTFLTLVNYSSLVTTNAARFRIAAGANMKLLEFGLRRAQGPDGGLSASRYSYIGGFDGTSNVLAGKLFKIPVKGTHAHAYVTSFTGLEELQTRTLKKFEPPAEESPSLEEISEEVVAKQDDEESVPAAVDAAAEDPAPTSEAAVEGETAPVPEEEETPAGQDAAVDNGEEKEGVEADVGEGAPAAGNADSVPAEAATAEAAPEEEGSAEAVAATVEEDSTPAEQPETGATAEAQKSVENTENEEDFVTLCVNWRLKLGDELNILVSEAHEGELAAFISYALAFPQSFLALIDTYDVSRSGILNFCAVALALNDLGYKAIGVRIDSGDLAYLSRIVQETFDRVSRTFELDWFASLMITASNDINEETILSLNEQGHKITCFGIGTHLVTCQRQPALGCVFKLVEVNGKPKIKLSQDVSKITMPGQKEAYRLYSSDGHALIDLLTRPGEEPPQVGKRVLCRHPFEESKRAYVMPHKVEPLYRKVWGEGKMINVPTLDQIRQNVQSSLKSLRQDHKRSLNPTPYKVGVSDDLYHFIHDLWLENAPIGELS